MALQFIVAVRAANIVDATLRDQAQRASKSAALDIAEAAGRESAKDKKRIFAIARGEVTDALAAIEIAAAAGEAQCIAIGARLVALLRGLIRRSRSGARDFGCGRRSSPHDADGEAAP